MSLISAAPGNLRGASGEKEFTPLLNASNLTTRVMVSAPDEHIARRPGDEDKADEVEHERDQADDEDAALSPFLNASNLTTRVKIEPLVPSKSITCNGDVLKGDWKPEDPHGKLEDWHLHMSRGKNCKVPLDRGHSMKFRFKHPVVHTRPTGFPKKFICNPKKKDKLEDNKCLTFHVADPPGYEHCHVLVINFDKTCHNYKADTVKEKLEAATWTPY